MSTSGDEPPATSNGSFRHEALLYAGDEDFADTLLPFVEDSIAKNEPIMVALPRRRLEIVASRLDGAADRVDLVDMEQLGANPARIIPAWAEFVASHAGSGRPLRGIGEPVWSGRSSDEVSECQLHEALLNVAFEDAGPFWLVCPYDRQGLDPEVVMAAERSHPTIAEGGAARESGCYCGHAAAEELFEAPLPAPAVDPDELAFRDGDQRTVRSFVLERALEAGIGAQRRDDLSLAVTEVTTNSVRHGAGEGSLLVWRDGGALVCEVRDGGSIDDLLVGRRRPTPDHHDGGWGLWIANQVCDLVQVRSGDAGNVVRLRMSAGGSRVALNASSDRRAPVRVG